jgi:hypothetical protein
VNAPAETKLIIDVSAIRGKYLNLNNYRPRKSSNPPVIAQRPINQIKIKPIISNTILVLCI